MKRFLNTLSIIVSLVSALFPKAQALHRARFALPHELRSLVSHIFDGKSLLLGISHFGGIYRVKSTPERRELGHLLVVAPTRGGKSLLAISQLLTWEHSVVVNDVKGELYAQTAGYRATLGPVYVIDPRGFGHQYDPLHAKTDEDELYAAAKNLLYEPREGDGKAFTEKGMKMQTLMWYAALELKRLSGQSVRLLPFTRKMADLGINPAAAAIHAISPVIAQRMLDGEYDPERDYTEYKYLANSWESVTARLYPLLTEKIVRCFDGSDFTGKDIITSPRPVSVYLCWPESAILAKAALIRLVVESLIAEMNDTYDAARGRNCRPVLLLLDEAGTVGIPNLARYAATAAGRGMSLWVAIQEFAQLDDLYGRYKAKTIRNNMGSKIFYRQEDDETASAIERALGRRSGYAHSQTLHNGQESSESLGEQAVPLLTARDVNELDPDEIIAFHTNRTNRKPFRGKRMDWRAFPILRQRQDIPPPTLSPLPPLTEIHLPSPWERRGNTPRFPIDPDTLN
jgi:type IV secretion system protein VirD4